MLKKTTAILLTTMFLLSSFALLTTIQPIQPAQAQSNQYVPKSTLYYYASRMSIAMYRWENNQWTWFETRTLAYQSYWYAKEMAYYYGAEFYNPLKPNEKYFDDDTYACKGNALVIGMEADGYGCDQGYDDIIICIDGNMYQDGTGTKYDVFIDCIFASGSYRLAIYSPDAPGGGAWIFDYQGSSGDRQKYAQQFGWSFYDSLFPEAEGGGGGGGPTLDSETTNYYTESDSTINSFLGDRISIQTKALVSGTWQYVDTRAFLEPANPNKGWMDIWQTQTRTTGTFTYTKWVIGIEDGDFTPAGQDNYIDVVLVAVYTYDSSTGLHQYKYDMIQLSGGLNKQIYYKDRVYNTWDMIFEGYSSYDNQHFAYNVVCESWY